MIPGQPSSGEYATKILYSSDATGKWAIYTIEPDGQGVKFLSDNNGLGATEANWSHDGNRIVYRSLDDIWIMNSDGTAAQQVTTNPSTDSSPALSPDGSKIAFVSHRDGNSEIYVINTDSSNELNLTEHPALDGDPDWSPDGTEIVFHSRRTGSDEVHIMSADGSNVRRITPGGLWTACEAWSPTGDRIAFGALDEIRVINTDGTDLIQVTNSPGQDNCPSWSPDGNRMVFHSIRDGNWEIYSVNVDGTNTIRLTDGPSNDHSPEWSPFLFVESPVDGRLRVTGLENPYCDNVDEIWTFCQHQGAGHELGGGVADADDTLAWDINLIGDADANRRVFPLAPGRVVRYGEVCLPCLSEGALLIEHQDSTGMIWWSGYLHMTGIPAFLEGEEVSRSTVLGFIGDTHATNNHLHLTVYQGQNTPGGLVARNAVFGERVFTDGFESGDVSFWSGGLQ
jgi:WD40 repeat protein